jgi:hypothetical protein
VPLRSQKKQIVVHDVIPTFFLSDSDLKTPAEANQAGPENEERGDLFESLPVCSAEKAEESIYKGEQLIWTLKWTHIQLFGMSLIFILMSAVVVFLDMGAAMRAWLIALPFLGIWIDIASMWLKGFVSPAFFWLHILRGGLFGFAFDLMSCSFNNDF